MYIKKLLIFLVCIALLSCSTDSGNANEKPRKFNELPNIKEELGLNENIYDFAYEVYGAAYLFSETGFVTVSRDYKSNNNTSNTSVAEDANAKIENIDLERQLEVPKPKLVSIIGIKSNIDGSFKKIIKHNSLLVLIEDGDQKIYAYVDSSDVYLDDKRTFLYAIDDDIDNRIRLNSNSYSVGHAIAFNKVYGPSDISGAYYSVDSSRTQKHCDLFDAAMLLSSIEYERRGEFETKEEFETRIETLKLLPNSTAWNEKIYFNWMRVSNTLFKYDIDKSEMKIIGVPDSMYSWEAIINGQWESRYSSGGITNSGKPSEMKNYMIRGNPTGQQCGKTTKINWYVEDLPSGDFNVDYKAGMYSRDGEIDGIGLSKIIQIGRDEARALKENAKESWFFMWGLKPSTARGSRSVREEIRGSYPNEYKVDVWSAPFYFDATIEYLMLVDSKGRLRASYFSNNYKENFIDNDLYIQSHAFRNKDISQDFIDNSSQEDQLAKYFFNAVREVTFDPDHKDRD